MRGWLCVVLVAAVSGLAIKSEVTESEGTNTNVPCTLCAAAMPEFLNFCKLHNGFSVPELSHWINTCGDIGEKSFQEADAKLGANKDSIMLRSRVRVIQRKDRCLKIYEGLSKTFAPFDPCTQIRNVVDSAAMAVCQGPNVRCVQPPTDEDIPYIPPANINASLPFEYPPLRCPQYVSRLVNECKVVKQDFYARSNLEQSCPSMYKNQTHQVSGCDIVRSRMVEQDSSMDLCSSLAAKPINTKFEEYCVQSLGLPANDFVPVAGYASYLERVREFKQLYSVKAPANVQVIRRPALAEAIEKDIPVAEAKPAQEIPVEVTANH